MKSMLYYFAIVVSLCGCSSHGQDSTGSPEIPKTDTGLFIPAESTGIGTLQRDDEISKPPFGLARVQKLVDSIHPIDDTDGDGQLEAIADREYASLSLPEKFTYNMINPEVSSQMCDILPERNHEGSRIYGHLPNVFGEFDWSQRQVDFFKANRDTVIALMKAEIEKEHKIGANLKSVIFQIDSKEMIPFLIDTYYTTGKDHYILTLLMLLMKDGNYPEFMKSASYLKLYDSKVTDEYSAFLAYNKANEDLIIQRATRYYHESASK
jgi:hypothetical protein